ncbi:zinc-dependent metalloprotease [Peribacillus sp. SCS-37]|uniref:zinc-dependent metalloprotease n=1 Tax=Paraperibacillus esterisolvens TaxID=3115296 RepID=UPI003905C800
MKDKVKILAASLLGALLICSSVSAETISLRTHEDHSAKSGTYIGDALPKAKEFKNSTKKAVIEEDTSVQVLDEKGSRVDTLSVKKNTDKKSVAALDGGTRKVTVLVVADEEYRAAYSDWQTRIQTIVETADNAFNRDHSVDFVVQAVGNWSSQGGNSSQLLADLARDWDGRGYDFAAGFSRDAAFDAGGIAYVYTGAPAGSAMSVNLDQGTANTAKAAQHEFPHNFGLSHDAQGSGIRCIMNYDYSYSVDYWHADHNAQIAANKYWYGN